MAGKHIGLSSELNQYLRSVSLREPQILNQLRNETAVLPMARMQISPEQGQFMAFLVQLMGATRALEIGVFTGYSSLAVALALPDQGRLVACDVSEEYATMARRFWQIAGVEHKITLHLAPALETLAQLIATGQGETFDFVFIDADKSNYDRYYEQSLQLLRPGGLMAIDNVLWGGQVADRAIQDKRTQAIRSFNQKVHQDDRVDITLVPIADGLTLIRKRT